MDKIAEAIRMLEHGKAPTYVYRVLGVNGSSMAKAIREATGHTPTYIYRRALAQNPEYRTGLNHQTLVNLRRDFPEDFTTGWEDMKWNA